MQRRVQRETIEINANLTLQQHKNGFSFGTDALLLSAFLPTKAHLDAVELGSGSGVISLLALQTQKFRKIHAVEIQPSYADGDGVIAQNAVQNGFCDRLIPLCADVREIRPETFGGEVTVVFSNPPYLAMGAGRSGANDVREAARRELNGTISDFCACAGRLLKYGGSFFVVYRPDRLCDLICAMRQNDLEPKRLVFVQKDAKHEPFAVLAEGKKGAHPALHTDVLCLYCEDGTPTERYQKIQKEGIFT